MAQQACVHVECCHLLTSQFPPWVICVRCKYVASIYINKCHTARSGRWYSCVPLERSDRFDSWSPLPRSLSSLSFLSHRFFHVVLVDNPTTPFFFP